MADKNPETYLTARPGKPSRSQNGTSPVFEDISPEAIRELREGCHEAYMGIYKLFYDGIRRFILALTRSQQDAEDITQNVFISIWERRESLDPSKSMRRYLYSAARYCVMEYFRKQKVRSSYAEYAGLDPFGETFSSEEEFIAKETELLARFVLDRMPRIRRQVFELSRYEGLSNEEIARRMNLSVSAVTSHIHNARKDLREVLTLFLVLFVLR